MHTCPECRSPCTCLVGEMGLTAFCTCTHGYWIDGSCPCDSLKSISPMCQVAGECCYVEGDGKPDEMDLARDELIRRDEEEKR